MSDLIQELMVPAAAAATAVPLTLLAFGLVPRAVLARNPRLASAAGPAVAAVAAGLAALAALPVLAGAVVHQRWAGPAGFGFGVLVDRLSAVLMVLVAFLVAVVARYARGYLGGNPGQGRFFRWLSLTGGSVLLLVVSDNLAQFFAAWVATSVCLHRLLVFNPGRPSAVLAARKKFVVSRLGDLCLLGAMALVWRVFGTWDFEALFRAVDAMRAAGPLPADARLGWIAGLLAFGALLKSAQFPFHSWLPDTMETPTPVSALMHAGIINAGGFLVLRLHSVVSLSPAAMALLAALGAFTAVFASLVMLTQSSIKRALAFSTVAQMGFMMLECGVGAFALALLHIVAHSLYKAHAFLGSGSGVGRVDWTAVRSREQAVRPMPVAAAVLVSAAASLAAAKAAGIDVWERAGTLLLAAIWAMSLAYLLVRLWSRRPDAGAAVLGLGVAAVGSGLYFGLHAAAEHWLAPVLPRVPTESVAGPVAVALVLGLFLLGLLFQAALPRWRGGPAIRALCVHARNGFYLNTLFNRAVAPLRFPN